MSSKHWVYKYSYILKWIIFYFSPLPKFLRPKRGKQPTLLMPMRKRIVSNEYFQTFLKKNPNLKSLPRYVCLILGNCQITFKLNKLVNIKYSLRCRNFLQVFFWRSVCRLNQGPSNLPSSVFLSIRTCYFFAQAQFMIYLYET